MIFVAIFHGMQILHASHADRKEKIVVNLSLSKFNFPLISKNHSTFLG